MALQRPQNVITMPFDAAAGAFRIVMASGTNAGNAAVSTASALGFIGVTVEPSSAGASLSAAVATAGVVQIVAGGSITAGNLVESNSTGAAVARTPAASGSAVKQIVGVALNTAASGALVDVLIQPQLTLA